MKKQLFPLLAALFVLAAGIPAPRAFASDSSSALRFFGTGTGQTDRVTIVIDDNGGGADASTPADIGAGSFTIEFCIRGNLADNTAAPAVSSDSSVATNAWINGNIVLDRDIWSDGTGNADDHDRDYGISLAQGRIMFGTGQNGADSVPDGENTIIGSVNVLDGQWHHVACIRDAATGTKTICIDGVTDFSQAGVSDDDISFPDDGVALNGGSTGANETLVIGAEKHDAGPAFPSFNGYVDELRLWKTALPKECLNRYDNRVLVNPSAGRGPADGFRDLVGYYRFEEGAGTSAADASGATHANGNSNNAGTVITGSGSAGAADWALQSVDPDNVCAVYNGTDFGGPLAGTVVESGFTRPLFVCSPPGDNERLFIVEQRDGNNGDASATGRIKIYKKTPDTTNATPFLAVSGVNTSNEEGLLGLAFHPNYAVNGFFYVYYTTSAGVGGDRTVVERYTVSSITGTTGTASPPGPDIADTTSAQIVMQFTQPQGNHNGGWIGFRSGDAGSYLYIASGDGGGADDNDGHTEPGGNAQDITSNLLGKILRVDVDGDDFVADPLRNYAIPPTNHFVGVTGDDEIWLYGIRNPWRASFDRSTGDFWLADVGQNNREEIDLRLAGTADSADNNYGWRLREGELQTPVPVPADPPNPGGPAPADNVEPLFAYGHDDTVVPANDRAINGFIFGRSITGGYVYRGPLTGYQGTYFFGDARSDKLWSLRQCNGVITEITERTSELVTGVVTGPEITSFGEDNQGNLYYCSRNGNIVQIIVDDPWHVWRNQEFTVEQLADETESGVAGNSDADRKTTIEEFLVNSDPNIDDGPLPFATTFETDGGADEFLTLSLMRDAQADGVVDVTGQTSGDLSIFADVPVGQVLIDTPTQYKFRDHVPITDGVPRFGQFKFELQ